jgi:hypothetical protein
MVQLHFPVLSRKAISAQNPGIEVVNPLKVG